MATAPPPQVLHNHVATIVKGQARPLTATTLSVTSGGVPVTEVESGSVVTLTAAVNAGSTTVTTGQVNFCDATAAYCEDIHILGSAQLTSAGTAVLKFIPGIGNSSYRAVFVGTNNDGPSSSAASALAVTGTGTPVASTTTIEQSGNPGDYTLSATVTGPGLLAPTGTVSLLDTSSGSAVLGAAPLVAGQADVNWVNSQTLFPGHTPESVLAGDFNGDGIPDLAVSTSSANPMPIFLGNGDGTFTPAPVSPATGPGFYPVAVGDFNGDGNADLAVIVESGELTILLGNGDGTFIPAPIGPTTAIYQYSVAVADFNGDGIPDLAVIAGSGELTILLGNGDGTFTPAAQSSATGDCGFASLAVGDFNGDGIQDLAVVNRCADTVKILLGNGDGTFTPTAISPPTGGEPNFVAVGDFNGDGIPDLAVSNVTTDTVTILLGNGGGTFTPTLISPATGQWPYYIAVGDFNRDGKADLAVGSASDAGGVTVLTGNGDGTFTATASLFPYVGPLTATIAVGAFERDGSVGLAVGNDEIQLTILTAQVTQTATATATGISPAGHGTHLVNASYLGDDNFLSSISGTTGLIAEPTAPPITWAPPAPITYGTALSATQLNATAAVAGTFVYTPAAGTVLGAATQTLSAAFTPADTLDYLPTTATLNLTVNQATSTAVLSGAPIEPIQNQAYLLTATVTGAGQQPGGTVQFTAGTTTVCTSTLNSSGLATCSYVPPSAGSISISAQYQGDANHHASSAGLTLDVLPAYDSAVHFGIDRTELVDSERLEGEVCVTSARKAPSTGTVKILDDPTLLTAEDLGRDGCAHFDDRPKLSLGTHVLIAVYSGDKNNPPGTSTPVTVTVSPVPVDLDVICGDNRFPYGKSYDCKVSAQSHAGPAAGSITYSLDGGAAVTSQLRNGYTGFTITRPAVGAHTVVVAYPQQTDYAAAGPIIRDFTVTSAPR